MKKTLLFIALVFTACTTKQKVNDSVIVSNGKDVNIVVIDSCEYLACCTYGARYVYTHKGNCKNPIHYTSKDTIKWHTHY